MRRSRSAATSAGSSSESLDRRVDVRAAPDRLEREPDAAVLRIELDGRSDPQPAHDRSGALEEPLHGREEVVDDRLRERCSQPHLRRCAHQVAVRDQHVVGQDFLRRAQHERRLAIASRREDDDVLPVAHVGGESGDLRLPVRECLVLGEVAEGERVRGDTHALHYALLHNAAWEYSAVV